MIIKQKGEDGTGRARGEALEEIAVYAMAAVLGLVLLKILNNVDKDLAIAASALVIWVSLRIHKHYQESIKSVDQKIKELKRVYTKAPWIICLEMVVQYELITRFFVALLGTVVASSLDSAITVGKTSMPMSQIGFVTTSASLDAEVILILPLIVWLSKSAAHRIKRNAFAWIFGFFTLDCIVCQGLAMWHLKNNPDPAYGTASIAGVVLFSVILMIGNGCGILWAKYTQGRYVISRLFSHLSSEDQQFLVNKAEQLSTQNR